MEWTPERARLLRDLWSQGFSASEIADKLGDVSRNAIIGKVHRLGLASRVEPTQPVAKSMPDSIVAAAVVHTAAQATSRPLAMQGATFRTAKQCQWPVGDPRQPGFHFCAASAHDGFPYCFEHAKVAYQSGLKKRPSQVQAPDENRPRMRDPLEDLVTGA